MLIIKKSNIYYYYFKFWIVTPFLVLINVFILSRFIYLINFKNRKIKGLITFNFLNSINPNPNGDWDWLKKIIKALPIIFSIILIILFLAIIENNLIYFFDINFQEFFRPLIYGIGTIIPLSFSLYLGLNSEDSNNNNESEEFTNIDNINLMNNDGDEDESKKPSSSSKGKGKATEDEVAHMNWEFDGIKEDIDSKRKTITDEAVNEGPSEYSKHKEDERKKALEKNRLPTSEEEMAAKTFVGSVKAILNNDASTEKLKYDLSKYPSLKAIEEEVEKNFNPYFDEFEDLQKGIKKPPLEIGELNSQPRPETSSLSTDNPTPTITSSPNAPVEPSTAAQDSVDTLPIINSQPSSTTALNPSQPGNPIPNSGQETENKDNCCCGSCGKCGDSCSCSIQ